MIMEAGKDWLAAAILGGALVAAVFVAIAPVGSWGPGGGGSPLLVRSSGSRPPAEARAMAEAPRPGPAGLVTIVTANLWNANPQPTDDLAELVALGTDVIGINEGRSFRRVLRRIPGYVLVMPDEVPAGRQNAILLRRRTTRFLGSGAERMCDSIGSAPERWAVYALFEVAGAQLAYVNTHLNSHVENDGRPFPLPRVDRYVEHLHRLSMLVRSLQGRGYRVVVGGDFNWAWTVDRPHWPHAPALFFDELGLSVNWAHRTAPPGGSFGDRRIDYLAHDPGVMTIADQRLVRGHSDHVWPLVSYLLRTEAKEGRAE